MESARPCERTQTASLSEVCSASLSDSWIKKTQEMPKGNVEHILIASTSVRVAETATIHYGP